jgi:phosphatidylglycerol:prolipoprotein diacylglycerol transferase
MRPVLVQYLNNHFGTGLFTSIVPDVTAVYTAAIFVCILIFVRRVRRAGLSEYHAWGAAIWGALAGIAGVRLWYLLWNLGAVIQNPAMILDMSGATVSFGGYLFGAAAVAGYLLIKKQSPLAYFDVAASCLGLGPMIGRWACFLNGDDYGTVTGLPWGVAYPPGSYAFADHVNKGLINLMADHSLTVHPVQLYLSFNGLVLFFICSWLWKKRKYPPGALFGIFWALYGATRFLFEFTRGDYPEKVLGFFTPGQVSCLVIASASLLFLVSLYVRGRRLRCMPSRWTEMSQSPISR